MYAWVNPLKDKKGITITNGFQKILDESNHKPNKIWVNKGSEFYDRSIKSFLQNNDIEMYSTHNERKYVIVERLMRTLRNKIYKYMNLNSKNVYYIVNKYNNIYHNAIKMKPVKIKHICWL